MNISNKKTKIDNEWVEITPVIYRTGNAITLEKVSFIGSTATVVVRVEHFSDVERIEKSTLFNDVNVELGITNDTIVDKRTGQYANETTPEEYRQGEFDFFYTQKIASMEESLSFGIMRADSLNRFD